MRVCLVGHSEVGLLDMPQGGSERQTALLAVHLASRGHDVTLVVPGYSGNDIRVKEVLLRSGWNGSRGIRFVRAFTYRHPTLRRVLASISADVYYSRGFSYFTPAAVKAARAADAIAVLAMASDTDLDPASGRFNFGIGGSVLSRLTGRLGYEWFRGTALRGAHCVFVQNQFQLQACAANNLPCHLLPSIVEDVPFELRSIRPTFDAVWVGNVSNKNRRSKGVAEFVRLAERSREATFVLVGDLSAVRNEDIIGRLHRLPNVELAGSLSHSQVVQRIAAARLVLNTSPSEGFSNVMLEGWSLHKPVVSLSVDPDHLLTQGGLGVCAGGDEWRMAHALELLLSDAVRRQAMGDAAHAYVSKVHSARAVCERFESLVNSLVAGSRAAGDLA